MVKRMGKKFGSVMVPASHPRFAELRATLPRSAGKTALMLPPDHPLYAEIVPTLKQCRWKPQGESPLNSTRAEYDESMTHGERGGIVRRAFALKSELAECEKDVQDLKEHLAAAEEKCGNARGELAHFMRDEFSKALKEGAIFNFQGGKWIYGKGEILEVIEELTFSDAPKARRKKAEQ
jgi:hypothetical protein